MKIIAMPVLACGLFAAAMAAAAGKASASQCDGPDCVPNVARNVVASSPCDPRQRYVFGLNFNGDTLVCISPPALHGAGRWASAMPLIGVRDLGAACYGNKGLAQSPDGIPLVCDNQVWAVYYTDLGD